MKICTKCNTAKEYSCFEKRYDKNRPNTIYRSDCKECRNKYKRELHNNDYWEVYLIYNTKYVGYSKQLGKRIQYHGLVNKFNISDIETLHICNSKREAREYEKIYHDIGFQGKYGFSRT